MKNKNVTVHGLAQEHSTHLLNAIYLAADGNPASVGNASAFNIDLAERLISLVGRDKTMEYVEKARDAGLSPTGFYSRSKAEAHCLSVYLDAKADRENA